MNEALVKKSEQEEKQLEYVGDIRTGTGLQAYEPSDLKAAMDLAQVLCTGGLVPRDLQNRPGDVLTLIATGREYGMSWPAALQNLYVVHGRIGAYAEFQRARIMQHPTCELFELVEASSERATFRVKKPTMDAAVDVTFTVEDAIKARLMKRLPSGEVVAEKGPDANWSKYTSDMLVARATTRAKRRYFPYVLTDVAAVEELRDLPAEKDVTPVSERADEAARKITAAAGRKEEPQPDRESAKRHAAQMAEKDVETDDEGGFDVSGPPEGESVETKTIDDPETETIERIPDHLRRALFKVDGVGPKVLESLEEGHATNVRAIYRLGASGLKKLAHIGPKTAENLVAWASNLIDETNRAEALKKKQESEEEAEDPTFYRDKQYVQALMQKAEEHGVTKAQLAAQRDKIAEAAGLPAGTDPRALPDPAWRKLTEWVESAVQDSLDFEEEETAEQEPAAGGPFISEGRQRMLQNTVQNLISQIEGEDQEGWLADFAAWLREHAPGAEAGLTKSPRDFSGVPEKKYGELLAWVTDSTQEWR